MTELDFWAENLTDNSIAGIVLEKGGCLSGALKAQYIPRRLKDSNRGLTVVKVTNLVHL